MDLRQKYEEFARRFGNRPPPAPEGQRGYWSEIEALFTRDVTRRDLAGLVRYETADTFRFLTRGVDFQALEERPWYERYPLITWRAFLAIAYRLSPARRIVFAVALPLLAAAWIRVLLGGSGDPGLTWTVLAGSALFVLLVLELRDKLGLKGDLEIARQIQFGLLPFQPIEAGRFAIRAFMRPANTVGGDYFDVIELEPNRTALVIGDVAGKGMPAALLMALLQGSLRTLVNAGFRECALVAQLNDHLCASIPTNRLVTLFLAELDCTTGEMVYVNAGHNPPRLVRRDGRLERLMPTAMALGVQAGTPVASGRVRIDAGERLLMFTDGIPEAFDGQDNEYGEERIETFLIARREHEEGLLDDLVADVLAFTGGVPPRDDMTLLLLSHRPQGAA